MASRMESTGEASKIHISDATKKILAKNDHYKFKCRGSVNIKGIGEQTTWWLYRNTETINERPMKMSASKDGLYMKKCIRSDNNFRRSSGLVLRHLSRDSNDFDFSIMQNAVKSNRNLITCDDTLVDSILPERRSIHKVNQSENHLSKNNSSITNFLEFPNNTKFNLNPFDYSPAANNTRLMNGNKRKEYYDQNDRLLISRELISDQSNDLNSERYDSYDNSFNLDHYSKPPLRTMESKKKKFHIGKSNDYDSSNENLDKKSKSCTDLKFF